jgi:SMC interacting uncharacterized protein involved in chromosome segregation
MDLMNNEIVSCNKKIEEIIPYKKTDNEGNIVVPGCKLCSLPCREEAENYYDQIKNYLGLKKWLKDVHDIEISYPSVRNHIIFHYKAHQKQENMQEYAKDVKKWMGMGSDKIGSLKKRKAILERELVGLGAEAEDLKSDEKRKHVDLMKKLADTLLDYDAKIDEFEVSMSPAKIILNQLNIIITEELSSGSNAETKQVLSKVLDNLNNSVKDLIPVEE